MKRQNKIENENKGAVTMEIKLCKYDKIIVFRCLKISSEIFGSRKIRRTTGFYGHQIGNVIRKGG